jgi:hypothetical protein
MERAIDVFGSLNLGAGFFTGCAGGGRVMTGLAVLAGALRAGTGAAFFAAGAGARFLGTDLEGNSVFSLIGVT